MWLFRHPSLPCLTLLDAKLRPHLVIGDRFCFDAVLLSVRDWRTLSS